MLRLRLWCDTITTILSLIPVIWQEGISYGSSYLISNLPDQNLQVIKLINILVFRNNDGDKYMKRKLFGLKGERKENKEYAMCLCAIQDYHVDSIVYIWCWKISNINTSICRRPCKCSHLYLINRSSIWIPITMNDNAVVAFVNKVCTATDII